MIKQIDQEYLELCRQVKQIEQECTELRYRTEQIEQEYFKLCYRAKKLKVFVFSCPNCDSIHLIQSGQNISCQCGEEWVVSTDCAVRNLKTFTSQQTKWTGELHPTLCPYFLNLED